MSNSSTLVLAAAGLTLALPCGPALAQASLDGHYQGTLVCEQMPLAPAILRAPLDVVVRNDAVVFARPLFNLRGTRVLGSEIANGTIEDGTVHLTSAGSTYGVRWQAEYSGTLRANGGVLTGTQHWTAMAGGAGSRARACVAALVKARWQPASGTAGEGGRRGPKSEERAPARDEDDED